jgi:hypothetical protein
MAPRKAVDVVRKLISELEDLGGGQLYVGIQGAEANREHPGSEYGETVGQIAAKNHFGTSGYLDSVTGEWVPAVPARPWLSEAMARKRDNIRKVVTKASRSVAAGKIDATKALDLVGLYMVGQVQETISEGVSPANSPLTIELKGSSKPLIDTGLLRQSHTHKVVK